MNLLGQAVRHKKFGKGVVTELSENKITVCFAENEKLFLFPDAFPRYLILKDHSMQRKIEKINEERQQEAEAKKKILERKNRYRNRLYTMKIPMKSQVVYNISQGEADSLEWVPTGTYLSGNMKGKPRIPSNIQPNSAILLSSCGKGGESERCIAGIAMADNCFWGKECEDGQIRLHSRHTCILAEENRPSFWKYFKREAFPAQWGRIPFKYFQNQAMQRILLDICRQTEGTEQEKEVQDFYDYFCLVNRIPEI